MNNGENDKTKQGGVTESEKNWDENIALEDEEALAPILKRLKKADADGEREVDASDIIFAEFWPISLEEKKKYPKNPFTFSRIDCKKWLRDNGLLDWNPRGENCFVKSKGLSTKG